MSNANLSLGERMKRYESVSKNYLMRRQPVIIRLDGVAFRTFTKGFEKPFDDNLMNIMQDTMVYLCENVQGCVIGYTQSDEISLVLCDYQKLDTDAWFGYNVQKLASVSASLATFIFNRNFRILTESLYISSDELDVMVNDMPLQQYYDNLCEAARKGATFDARAFTLPVEEVNNYLLWRQRAATLNSIQALGQSSCSHKELESDGNKSLQDNLKDLENNELADILTKYNVKAKTIPEIRFMSKMFTEKGINWNDLSTCKKRGSCCIYKDGKWSIDYEIPIFSQCTDYVKSRIVFE